MPTTLQAKLTALETIPPFDPEDDDLCARWDVLFDYFCRSAPLWYHDDVELSVPVRASVAALWKRRADLRGYLNQLILRYPCDELKRAFVLLARDGAGGDHAAWYAFFPDLKAYLHPFIVARARRFNQAFTAIHACTLWIRHHDGGEEGYRQIALTIHRDDRRQARRREPSDFLRHDLETHGTLSPHEAEETNRFLLELGADPLRPWR